MAHQPEDLLLEEELPNLEEARERLHEEMMKLEIEGKKKKIELIEAEIKIINTHLLHPDADPKKKAKLTADVLKLTKDVDDLSSEVEFAEGQDDTNDEDDDDVHQELLLEEKLYEAISKGEIQEPPSDFIRVFISRLQKQTTTDEVKKLCAKGKNIWIQEGFAFMFFETDEDAAEAVTSLNGTKFMGRRLVAQISD